MVKLLLRPVDTFFFQNQRISAAGSDSTMSGIFPPRPNTIYGALRSAYIHAHMSFEDYRAGLNEEVKKWMGTPDQLGEFALKYCGLFYKDNLMLPLPLDHQVIEARGVPLMPTKDNGLSSATDSVWRLMSTHKEKSKSPGNQYATIGHWKKSLLGQSIVRELIPLSDMIVSEPKIGIALDPHHRRARKSYLYQIEKLRFNEEGALVVFASPCPDFSSIRFARIGGENRPWTIQQEEEHFTLWNGDELQELKQQLRESKIARIILLSPAIWEQGSRPNCFDGKWLTLPNRLSVKWLTAALGRPVLYGGWDIVKNRPKKRYFMVPEGSVIYISIEEEQIDLLLELANGFSFTDQREKEGFGYSVIAPAKK